MIYSGPYSTDPPAQLRIMYPATLSEKNYLMALIKEYCQHLQYVLARSHQQPESARLATILIRRRLLLVSHVIRHDEVASKVLPWKPPDPRRRGHPTTTLREIIEKDTMLRAADLVNIMTNDDRWKEHIMLITLSGLCM